MRYTKRVGGAAASAEAGTVLRKLTCQLVSSRCARKSCQDKSIDKNKTQAKLILGSKNAEALMASPVGATSKFERKRYIQYSSHLIDTVKFSRECWFLTH